MATMMSTIEVIDTYIKENRPDLAFFHMLNMNNEQIQDFDAEQIQNLEIDIYYQMGFYNLYVNELRSKYMTLLNQVPRVDTKLIKLERQEKDRLVKLTTNSPSTFLKSEVPLPVDYEDDKLDVNWISCLIESYFLFKLSDLKQEMLLKNIKSYIHKCSEKEGLFIKLCTNLSFENLDDYNTLLNLIDDAYNDNCLEILYRATLHIIDNHEFKTYILKAYLNKLLDEGRFEEHIYYYKAFSKKPFLCIHSEETINSYSLAKALISTHPDTINNCLKKQTLILSSLSKRNEKTALDKRYNYFLESFINGFEISSESIMELQNQCNDYYQKKHDLALATFNAKRESIFALIQDSSFVEASSMLLNLSVLNGYLGDFVVKYRKFKNYLAITPINAGAYQVAKIFKDFFYEYDRALSICESGIKEVDQNSKAYINLVEMMYQIYNKNKSDKQNALLCIEKIADHDDHSKAQYISALIVTDNNEKLYNIFCKMLNSDVESSNEKMMSRISKHLINTEYWTDLYKSLVTKEPKNEFIMKQIWTIANNKQDILVLNFWNENYRSVFELNGEQEEERTNSINKCIKQSMLRLSDNLHSEMKRMKDNFDVFNNIHNYEITVNKKGKGLPYELMKSEENLVAKGDYIEKFRVSYKYWLMFPHESEFDWITAVKMADFGENDYKFWGIYSKTSVNTTFKLFKELVKPKKMADYESFQKNLNYYCYKFLLFIMNNKDLRLNYKIQYERAYYYALFITNGIVDWYHMFKKVEKEFSSEFIKALDGLNENTFYDDTNINRINSDKKVFEELIENKYFIKMSDYIRMNKAVKAHLEKEYVINFDAYLKIEDGEKKKYYLLRHLKLGDVEFVKKCIEYKNSYVNVPLYRAIINYINYFMEDSNTSESYLNILDDDDDFRRTQSIIGFSKKMISDGKYELCNKFLSDMELLYENVTEISFYKLISFYLNNKLDENSVSFRVEATDLISLQFERMLELEQSELSIQLPALLSWIIEIVVSTILIGLSQKVFFDVEQLLKKIKFNLGQVEIKIKSDSTLNYTDEYSKFDEYNKLNMIIESSSKLSKLYDEIIKNNNLIHELPQFINLMLFSDLSYFALNKEKFSSGLQSEPIRSLLEVLMREKTRKAILILNADQEIDFEEFQDFTDEVYKASQTENLPELFINFTEFEKSFKKKANEIKRNFKSEEFPNEINELLFNKLIIAGYLFDRNSLSVLIEKMVKFGYYDDTTKLILISYLEKVQDNEVVKVMKSHLYFKNKEYEKAYSILKTLPRELIRKNQTTNNIFLISALMASSDLEVLNGTFDEVKSVFRRLFNNKNGNLDHERGIIFDKIKESENDTLLLVWKINEYTLAKDYNGAVEINSKLSEINPFHGSYYSLKIENWKAGHQLEISQEQLYDSKIESSYCVSSFLDSLISKIQYPTVVAHIAMTRSECYFEAKMNWKDALKTTDTFDKNRAYVYFLDHECPDDERILRLFEYLIFLVKDFQAFEFNILVKIYIEGLLIFENQFNEKYTDELELYCKLFFAILMRAKSLKVLGETSTRILNHIETCQKIPKSLFEHYRDLEVLSEIDEMDYNDKVKHLVKLIDKLKKTKSTEIISSFIDIIKLNLIRNLNVYQSLYFKAHKFDYFISYSSEDYEKVIQMKEKLELENKSVWMDKKNLKASIDDYPVQIHEAIDKSAYVLMFLSENVIKKYINIYELEYMPSKYMGKIIFPILLDDKFNSLFDKSKNYTLRTMYAYIIEKQSAINASDVNSAVKEIISRT